MGYENVVFRALANKKSTENLKSKICIYIKYATLMQETFFDKKTEKICKGLDNWDG